MTLHNQDSRQADGHSPSRVEDAFAVVMGREDAVNIQRGRAGHVDKMFVLHKADSGQGIAEGQSVGWTNTKKSLARLTQHPMLAIALPNQRSGRNRCP